MAFSYISAGLTPVPRKAAIDRAMKALELRKAEFDTIAVRGVSGLCISAILAHLLEKPLIVVRKPKELLGDQHTRLAVETLLESGAYLIVDDQVSSGNTVETIVRDINNHHPGLKPVGLWLWNQWYEPGAKRFKDLNVPYWS